MRHWTNINTHTQQPDTYSFAAAAAIAGQVYVICFPFDLWLSLVESSDSLAYTVNPTNEMHLFCCEQYRKRKTMAMTPSRTTSGRKLIFKSQHRHYWFGFHSYCHLTFCIIWVYQSTSQRKLFPSAFCIRFADRWRISIAVVEIRDSFTWRTQLISILNLRFEHIFGSVVFYRQSECNSVIQVDVNRRLGSLWMRNFVRPIECVWSTSAWAWRQQ